MATLREIIMSRVAVSILRLLDAEGRLPVGVTVDWLAGQEAER